MSDTREERMEALAYDREQERRRQHPDGNDPDVDWEDEEDES